MRSLVAATLLVFTASACKDKPPEPKLGAGSSVGSAAIAVSPTPTKIDGPAVSPVITNNITFVVPAATSMWAEMNFACYRAVMTLQGGGPEKAAEAFEGISPKVPGAMKAAEIDLGRDLQAIGGFDCGDGSPCFYIAAHLKKPEKLKDALAVLVPDATPKEEGKLHFTTQTAGAAGPRTLHIRAIPIQWPAVVPSDAYATQQRTATHVVFIGGVDGKNIDADPMTKLATDGVATVNESEKLLADTHNRCMIGRVASRDFVPGFKLTGATFALGVPPAKAPDAMLKLLGSEKTFDLQFDLGISPTPKEADVQTWITMGKAWLGDIGQNVRASFAGQDAAMDIYFDMLSMVGEGGFRHALTDKGVRFSWRTDRIPASNITALDAKLNALAQ